MSIVIVGWRGIAVLAVPVIGCIVHETGVTQVWMSPIETIVNDGDSYSEESVKMS